MLPQQLEHLAAPPALRHRPIRGLVVADGLRPLALGRVAHGDDAVLVEVLGVGGDGSRGCLAVGNGRVGGRGGIVLGCPVVDVPVVFVEEEVVLGELGFGHGLEVFGGEGGEEEVAFQGSAFAGLV